MGAFQVGRVASELLLLSSLCLSAFAAPTTSGASTKQWTFSEVRGLLQPSFTQCGMLTLLDSSFKGSQMV